MKPERRSHRELTVDGERTESSPQEVRQEVRRLADQSFGRTDSEAVCAPYLTRPMPAG
jgi:hypothetical protein